MTPTYRMRTAAGDFYDIPEDRIDEFRAQAPDAQRVWQYKAGGETYSLPGEVVGDFLKKNPDAEPVYSFRDGDGPVRRITKADADYEWMFRSGSAPASAPPSAPMDAESRSRLLDGTRAELEEIVASGDSTPEERRMAAWGIERLGGDVSGYGDGQLMFASGQMRALALERKRRLGAPASGVLENGEADPDYAFSAQNMARRIEAGVPFSQREVALMDDDDRDAYHRLLAGRNAREFVEESNKRKNPAARRVTEKDYFGARILQRDFLSDQIDYILEHRDRAKPSSVREAEKWRKTLDEMPPHAWDALTDGEISEIAGRVGAIHKEVGDKRGHMEVAKDAILRGNRSLGLMLYTGWQALKPWGDLEGQTEHLALLNDIVKNENEAKTPTKIGSTSNIHGAGDVWDFILESTGENAERFAVGALAAYATGGAAAALGATGAAATAAGMAGTSAATLAMNTGEAVGDQLDEGLKLSRGYALAQGVGYSLLDGALGAEQMVGRGMRVAKSALSDAAKKGGIKILGRAAAKDAAVADAVSALRETGKASTLKGWAANVLKETAFEAVQEPAQSQIVGRGRRWMQTGSALRDGETTGEAWREAFDEAMGGAAASVLMGGAGAALQTARARKAVRMANNASNMIAGIDEFKRLTPENQLLVGRYIVNQALLATDGSTVLSPQERKLAEGVNRQILSELEGSRKAADADALKMLGLTTSQFAMEDAETALAAAKERGLKSPITAEMVREGKGDALMLPDGSRGVVYLPAEGSGVALVEQHDENGKVKGYVVVNNGDLKEAFTAKNYVTLDDAERGDGGKSLFGKAVEKLQEADLYNRYRAARGAEKREAIKSAAQRIYSHYGRGKKDGDEVNVVVVDNARALAKLAASGDEEAKGFLNTLAKEPRAAAFQLPMRNLVVVMADRIDSMGQLYTTLMHEDGHRRIAEHIRGERSRADMSVDEVEAGRRRIFGGENEDETEAREEVFAERYSVQDVVDALAGKTKPGNSLLDRIRKRMSDDTGFVLDSISDDSVREELRYLAEGGYLGGEVQSEVLTRTMEDSPEADALAMIKERDDLVRQDDGVRRIIGEEIARGRERAQAGRAEADAYEARERADAEAERGRRRDMAVAAEVADASARDERTGRRASDVEAAFDAAGEEMGRGRERAQERGAAERAEADERARTDAEGRERAAARKKDVEAALDDGEVLETTKEETEDETGNGADEAQPQPEQGGEVERQGEGARPRRVEAPQARGEARDEVNSAPKKKRRKSRMELTSVVAYDEDPDSGSTGLYRSAGQVKTPVDWSRTNRGGKVFLGGEAEWADFINDLLEPYGGLVMSKNGKMRLRKAHGAEIVPKQLRPYFGRSFEQGSNDGLQGRIAEDLNLPYVAEMTPAQLIAAIDADRRNYAAWAERKNRELRGEKVETPEERYHREQAEADRANTAEIAGESYHIDELEARDAADAEYDNALAEVERYDSDSASRGEVIGPFEYGRLRGLKEGDALRFDHSDRTFEVVGFDPEANVLTLVDVRRDLFGEDTPDGAPAVTRMGVRDVVKYLVSEDGVRQINPAPLGYATEEAENGRRDENGTSQDRAGDEGGEQGREALDLDGGTADGIAEEERRRGERREIERRRNAPARSAPSLAAAKPAPKAKAEAAAKPVAKPAAKPDAKAVAAAARRLGMLAYSSDAQLRAALDVARRHSDDPRMAQRIADIEAVVADRAAKGRKPVSKAEVARAEALAELDRAVNDRALRLPSEELRTRRAEGRESGDGDAVRFKRAQSADGIESYETDDAVRRLPYRERIKAFRDLMANEYAGRTARFVRNGEVYYAPFDREDVKKNVYGDNQSDARGRKAKINIGASGDIFDLVENARYDHTSAETGKSNPAHKDVKSWDYFDKTVRIDGTQFDVLVNVRDKGNDQYVYNVALTESKNAKPGSALPNESAYGGGLPGSMADSIPNSRRESNGEDSGVRFKTSGIFGTAALAALSTVPGHMTEAESPGSDIEIVSDASALREMQGKDGLRADGTKKGFGFFGPLKMADGKVMSELGAGFEYNGNEVEVPLVNPLLTRQELAYLLRGYYSDGDPMMKSIFRKGAEWGRRRLAEGKSPFIEEGESRTPIPKEDSGVRFKRSQLNGRSENGILRAVDQQRLTTVMRGVADGELKHPRFTKEEVAASKGKEHERLWNYILSLESADADAGGSADFAQGKGGASAQGGGGMGRLGRMATRYGRDPRDVIAEKHKYFDRGAESRVYVEDPKTVVKVRELRAYDIAGAVDALANIVYHNYLFPNDAYTLNDIAVWNNNGRDQFDLILEQPFVTPKIDANGNVVAPTEDRIFAALQKTPQRFSIWDEAWVRDDGEDSDGDFSSADFAPSARKIAYNGQFMVYDFKPGRNTFIDAATGEVRFIDPRVAVNDPGAGFSVSRFGKRRIDRRSFELPPSRPSDGVRFKRAEGGYRSADADDPNVYFGAKASLAAHGYDVKTAKALGTAYTVADVADRAREIAKDERRMRELVRESKTSDRPLALVDGLALGEYYRVLQERSKELDERIAASPNPKAFGAERELLDAMLNNVADAVQRQYSKAGGITNAAKIGFAADMRDTAPYILAQVRAIRAAKGHSPELSETDRAMVEDHAKRLKEKSDEIGKAEKEVAERHAKAHEAEAAEVLETERRKARNAAPKTLSAERRARASRLIGETISDAEATALGGLDEIFGGGAMFKAGDGIAAPTLTDDIASRFAAYVEANGGDYAKSESKIAKLYPKAAPLFAEFRRRYEGKAAPTKAARAASAVSLDESREAAKMAVAENPDDGRAVRKALGRHLRKFMRSVVMGDPSLSNAEVFRLMAEEANRVHPDGDYDATAMLSVLTGRDGFDLATRINTLRKLNDLKQALSLAKSGRLTEAAEKAGVPYRSETELVADMESQLKSILDEKTAKMDELLENFSPENAAQVERVKALREEVKKVNAALRRMKSDETAAEKAKAAADALEAEIAAKEAELARMREGSGDADALRARVRELRSALRGLDRQKRLETRLQKRVDELQKRIADKDYDVDVARRRVNDEALRAKIAMLRERRAGLRKRLEQERRKRVYDAMTGLEKTVSGVGGILGEMKAVVASFDLSSVLRQGGQLTFAHPLLAAKNLKETLKAWRSAEYADKLMADLRQRANWKFYEKAGIDFTDWGEAAGNADDRFLLNQYRKVTNLKFIKGGVMASERAFGAFLNLMRADVFDAMVAGSTQGSAAAMTDSQLNALGNFINIASQRGAFDKDGNLAKAIPAANIVLWSPRNMISRFQFLFNTAKLAVPGLNPYGDRTLRGLFAKELVRYIGGMGAMAMFLKAVNELLFRKPDDPPDDTEFDPRSSDFLKVRFGNVRVDLTSGLTPIMVFGTRMVGGETKNLRGQVRESNYYELMGRFARQKFAPGASILFDTLVRKDFERRDIDWWGSAWEKDAEHVSGLR